MGVCCCITKVDWALPENEKPKDSSQGQSSVPYEIVEARKDFPYKVPPFKNKNPNLQKYQILKVLGKGSFGTVYLVRKKNSNKLFAMKALKKEHLKRKNQIVHTQTERQILGSSECNFIVKLRAAFQTPEKLYMVMEYMQGGELFFHLKKARMFSEPMACFYAAELICGLSYLHSIGIIYRDLKPENVLMNAQGHIKLADFGLSKESLDETEKAHTFCGTPEYLSPELIKGEGHNYKIDWWSLGIMIYEMIMGRPPFRSKDRVELFRQILEDEPIFKEENSPEIIELITGLLKKKPEERLGSKCGEEIKTHSFFKFVDWEKFESCEATPPFIPKIAGGYDVSNFDKRFTNRSPMETPYLNNGMSIASFKGFTYATE